MTNYQEYNAEDFAATESFQDYYLFKKEEAISFWENWIAQFPYKNEEIEEAKKILDILQVKVGKEEIGDAFLHLKNKLEDDNSSVSKKSNTKRRFIQMISGAAAAIVLLLTASYFLLPKPSPVWSTTKTAFGEIKELRLPDGSNVFLNSNSSLKYDRNWTEETNREIWLEGEAYFNVTSNPEIGAAKFIVHSNESNVQVLGTSFNVYNRNKKTTVALESGKVEVQYKSEKGLEKQLMIPKDVFEITANGQTVYTQAANTALHTSWKENKLVLDGTPLRKVVDILEENFGFTVSIKNKEILDRKLTATIPIVDVNILLDALKEIYDLNIKRTNQNISIE